MVWNQSLWKQFLYLLPKTNPGIFGQSIHFIGVNAGRKLHFLYPIESHIPNTLPYQLQPDYYDSLCSPSFAEVYGRNGDKAGEIKNPKFLHDCYIRICLLKVSYRNTGSILILLPVLTRQCGQIRNKPVNIFNPGSLQACYSTDHTRLPGCRTDCDNRCIAEPRLNDMNCMLNFMNLILGAYWCWRF